MRSLHAPNRNDLGEIARIPLGEVAVASPPGIVRAVEVGIILGLVVFATQRVIDGTVSARVGDWRGQSGLARGQADSASASAPRH